jgi:tripartite-type tricarboxylate transporter receptor subunit TctC
MKCRIGLVFAALAFAACAVTAAQAQEFPTRPIRFVLGFGAGGLGDIAARALGQKMSESLGKPVVIENMPGAGGMTAAASVARAAPDGHTILWVSGQNAISPSMFKSMPYNWDTELTPVSMVGTFDFVILVDKNSPLKTVGDLVDAAKKDPSRFNGGSISVGSAQHLSALMFASMAGINLTIVPFRTTGDVVTALASGNIQVGFETLPGGIGHVKSGTLRALAVSSERRVPYLPDVPTVAESGVPEYNLLSWNGVVMPARTPRDIVLRLNKALNDALATSEVRSRFAELVLDPRPSTPEELQAIYQADVARWRKVFRDANIAPQ